MKPYEVYIQPDVMERNAMLWCWENFARFAGISFYYTDNPNAAFSIGNAKENTVAYNTRFWGKINQQKYSGKNHLNQAGFIEFENGEIDYFGTAFYFVNCIWEYDTSQRDELGRSDFRQSVWHEMGLDCTQNRVAEIYRIIGEKLKINIPEKKSQLFLSHDIDSVYGAWKEDGKAALKKGRLLDFFKIQWENISGKPQWLNIQEIINIETLYNARSTFFWLTEKGRINKRKTNADYSLQDENIKKNIKLCSEKGLHKSLSNKSMKEEFLLLNPAERINRYHYLHFSIPACYMEWEEANLMADCSLGYAETFGFRNGYGLPYYPFDLVNRKIINTLEIPLHIMDGTFSKYKNWNAAEAEKEIVSFIDNNKQHAIISILWHNSHFTDFKYEGYPQLYEKILAYCSGNQFEFTTVEKLIQENPLYSC
ncbi:MAG: hypothetical protein MH137_13525 [Flavobacteriales bacterium]|nr:hypothetical protein [Flavobacteriales bacterium]